MAHNVAMKLLTFWPDETEVWFAQADAQFAIKAVTVSKTKFYHSVAVLHQDVAAQILNLIPLLQIELPTRYLRID